MKRFRNRLVRLTGLATATLLSACGGGADDDTPSAAPSRDDIPPVITVNGHDPVGVVLGSSYTDAGATAIDMVDGNVAVVTSGTVDTTTEGSYTITYTAVDNAGNSATATRMVYVDGTAPVITVNGDDPLSVALGSSYADAGAMAVDAIDGNLAVTVSGTLDTSTEGGYTIAYSATDSVGNTATATRTVYVDGTAPVMSVNGANPLGIALGSSWADAGATAVDAIDGNVAVTTNGKVDTGTEGTYTIAYSTTDSVGNTAIATRTVYVDGTAPVITVNGDEPLSVARGSIYADAGATAFDAFDGNVAVTATGTVDTATEGSYTIIYTATDSVGNAATATRTVYVDGTAPVITVNGDDPLSVALDSLYTDAGATASDTVDGNVAVTTSGTVDTGTEGSYTITYTTTDRVGNTATAIRTVYVDGTAPVITVNGDDPLSVALDSLYADAGATASDTVDGNVAVTTSGTVDTATEGRYTITYGATDSVGNRATATRTVNVARPVFSFSTQEAREPLLNVTTGNIGGGTALEVALSSDGRTAYITTQGTSQDILRIVDVSDPASPVWLASYDISSTSTTVVLSHDDRTAYLADGVDGLRIVDVSNPASPTLLTTYGTIGAAYHVTLSSDGSKAYIAEGGDGMEIIDVSNPALPNQLGVSAWDARKIVLSSDDSKAYAVRTNGLAIHDVSDPTAPSFLASKTLPGTGSGTDIAVSSDGRIAYLSATNDGLRVVDVSNPASPEWLASFDDGGYATHIALSPDDSKLYMSTSSHGLYIFNVSNPAAPSLWHKYYTGTSANPGSSYRAAFSNDGTKVYFANGAKGVQILTSPALPALLGNFKDPFGNSANAACLSSDGSKAYVADGGYGLRIVNITNPASPGLLGTYHDAFSSGGANGVVLAGDGNTAYVADGAAGLTIVNVSNPASPSLSGIYDTLDAHDVVLSSDGRTAYVADGFTGLQIIDVSDPAAPAWLGAYNTSSSAFGVALSGDDNIAYVADDYDGLQIIDVSDPGVPVRLGRYDTDSAMAVALSRDGSMAYVADNAAGLKIIDISNPASPSLLGSYDTTGFAFHVAVSADGRRAYVADDVSGLHTIDVSDPASPFWLATYDTIYASGVMLSSDSSSAYVADRHGGLKILDISQDNLYKGRNFGNSHVALHIQSNVQIPLTLQVTADRADIITVNSPMTLEYADYNEQDVLIPITSITNAGGWTELTITLSYGLQTTSRKVYVWVVKV